MMKNIYKDSWAEHFESDEHADFKDSLTEFSNAAKWTSINAADVTFVPLSAVYEHELAEGDADTLADSKIGEMPVAVHMDEAVKTFLMRGYLFKNVKQQFRDDAAILSDMLTAGNTEDFCDHLNMSKKYLKKKKIQMLVRGEKISGWFSDFNHNWSQIEQLEFLEKELTARFPNMSFVSGEINHTFTEARYALDESIRAKSISGEEEGVVDAYLSAWERSGGDRASMENAVPVLRFNTGESGLFSIVCSPLLKLAPCKEYPKGTTLFLGTALSVNHRGSDKAVWEKFAKFPDNIATLYTKGMKGLAAMCKTRISHPYCAVTHALKLFTSSVPLKVLKEICGDTEIIFGGPDDTEPCFAIDLYKNVSSKIQSSFGSSTPLKQFQNQELLARLCNANWEEFDKARPAALFAPKEDPEIELIAV